MYREKSQAEAVAIRDGRFVAVGNYKEIAAFIGPRTKKIDAGGKLMLPGFNDAHVHFAAVGNKFSSIDLRRMKSADDVAEIFSRYSKVLPTNRWILGSGWDASLKGNALSRKVIDPLTPNNPVLVYSADGKWAFANGVALELAQVAESTIGEQIERDANGEPTGFVTGSALRRINSIIPANHTKNWPEILETASNYAASLGVTSVQDMHSDDMTDVYRRLQRQGKLKTRVYDCLPPSSIPTLIANGVEAAAGDAMVRTGCIKHFSEGEESEVADLRQKISAADKAGLQVMIHAIGSQANRIVLDAF